MKHPASALGPGPFRPEHVAEGSHYELSDGHAIQCLPTKGEGGRAQALGAQVLDTDPASDGAGVDVGYELGERTLRAPDVVVGGVPDKDEWAQGAPPLAVEYAGSGQDESDLKVKIQELHAAGTELVWVVRVHGLRRVDVHQRGVPGKQTVLAGGVLHAPGILSEPVPVEALWDRKAAHAATLRNLLKRLGYDSVEAVRDEGRNEGREGGRVEGLRAALLRVLEVRGLALDDAQRARVDAADPAALQVWLERAVTAASAADVL